MIAFCGLRAVFRRRSVIVVDIIRKGMSERSDLFRPRLLTSRAAVRLLARFCAGRFLRHFAFVPIVSQRGNSFRSRLLSS